MSSNQNNSFHRQVDQRRVDSTNGVETSQDHSSSTSSLAQNVETTFSLNDLKAMFKSAIDAEVVEMIWQNSNENSDIALTFLTEMSPTSPVSPPIPTTVKTNSWSSVLGKDDSKPFTMNLGAKPKTTTKEKHWMIDLIETRIKRREKLLIIMRGVPGSGKSYLAHQLKGNGVVYSTDDFFINYQGQYLFDRNKLGDAHEWNQKRANEALKSGTNPVVIDNTNLEAWEMQPYIFMALRYDYLVELVEPNTPWRDDARVLSQKNIHRVPREKIKEMLEKQKVVIDISIVIENCRLKINQTFEGSRTSTNRIENVQNPLIPSSLKESPDLNFKISTSSSLVNVANRNCCNEQAIEKSASLPHILPFSSENTFIPKAIIGPPPDVLMTTDMATGLKPSTSEAAIQTSLFESEPPLRELTARNRSIQSSHFVPDLGKKPCSSKFSLDKGCLTDEIVEELATREALAILKSYFPTKETEDLADILKQCNGDLTWAVNVLLDSGYECADEVSNYLDLEIDIDPSEETPNPDNIVAKSCTETIENVSQQAKEEETNSVTSSETSQQSFSTASATSEETESVRKHIEDCFQLTDTISEQTRRICGKDYNQFRASQLQKSRHGHNQVSDIHSTSNSSGSLSSFETQPKNEATNLLCLASFPSLGEQPTNGADCRIEPNGIENVLGVDLLQPFPVVSPPLLEEEVKVESGPMIPMTLDPSFVQQLIKLFGVPDLKAKRPLSANQSNSVSFDIPWSLAEQIYLHWCSSLISKDEEFATATGDTGELQNIMDFELAMQLVQDERNAERKELRESLSTKISFQMLQENYPYVDPLALDALFEANNYNYSHTVTALNASLGTNPQPKPQIISANPPAAREETQPKTPNRDTKSSPQESRNLRTEAFLYNKLRQQYSAQAQEYHQRGMSAAAMYYSSESRRYAELYKKCNQQAALQIVEEKNAHQDERTIDLHELHVVEALTCLESFIVENIREGRTVIQVITGRGNNSQNGRPRIKPAVVTFLRQKKYGFEQVNPGCLRVFLSRSTTH